MDIGFERPNDYKLTEHWKRRKTLRILSEKKLSNSYLLEILFDIKFEAMHFIFEWGSKIKLIEPKAFIDDLIEKSNEILCLYKN